jgi:hypothetical protein
MKSMIVAACAALAVYSAGCSTTEKVSESDVSAGVYMTDQGAESLVKSTVDEVYDGSQEALNDMGIRIKDSGMTPDGKVRTILAEKDDTDVLVKMAQSGDSVDQTKVEVIAQKGAETWDKDYARKVMQEIIKKS